MKKQILKLLTLLVAIPLLSVSQNYIPFPDSGAVWHETYWWQPSPFFYNGIGDTYILGDTVFNDTIYKKIYNLRRDVFCSDIIISEPEFECGLREDTIAKKVYHRWGEFASETLLYDYSLEIGDTLQITWYSPYYGVYITSIDTITTFDNVQRRVWYLDCVEPFVGWPQIVEGIGSTSGLVGSIEPYWEGWNELLCYDVDGEEVWRSWRDTCYVFTDSCATVGINETVQQEIGIKSFPSPAKDLLKITLSENAEGNHIVLYNSSGQAVKSLQLQAAKQKYEFTVSGLPAGLYVVVLLDDGKVVGKEKVVVSH